MNYFIILIIYSKKIPLVVLPFCWNSSNLSCLIGSLKYNGDCGNHVNAEYRSKMRTGEVKEWQINTH